MSLATTAAIPWQGFHHVAVITPNLDGTIQFYTQVLGMQAGDIMGSAAGGQARHCFIKPGDAATWGLHVFENPAAEAFTRFEPAKSMLDGTGSRFAFFDDVVQHIAFALPDEAAALVLRDRLQAHNVLMTDISHVGPILRNFLFLDNNGFILEATWSKA